MSKRFREQHPVGDIIKDIIANNPLGEGINQVLVEKTWGAVMGSGIVRYTDALQFKKGKLIVFFNSSVVREELGYGKEKIIRMLNEELGQDLITELLLK